MYLESINVNQIRILIILGTLMLGTFMFADLALLPDSLHEEYFTSRFAMQLPICLLFFLSTFIPNFQKIYQPILTISMLSLVYCNYWLIVRCWQLEQVGFPYEGTIMYSLFCLFIFRLKFIFAIPYALITLLGFTVLVVVYPVYAENNIINLGFVLVSLVVGLLGVYRLELAANQLHEKNLQLTHLNQFDLLTDILNRGTYEHRFNEKLELNKRYGNNVCVYFIDLDFFKDYNDGHGHPQGDKIIKLQASMLKEIFQRSTDIVARYGGEEFVVVTSKIDLKSSKQFAQQILEKWYEKQEPHNKGRAGPFVSCSIGFHIEQANINSTISEMVKKADQALYQAKANGRNCAVLYQEKTDV